MSTETMTGDEIGIQGAPSIPELAFRRFRGAEDFPAMVEVLHAHAAANDEEDARTVEDIARAYSNLKNSDPSKDVVMVEIDGKLVAYSRVEWYVEEATGAHIYNHFMFMVPDLWGKGIEGALVGHNEKRLREISGEHHAEAPKYFETGTAQAQEALREVLLAKGYEPVRTFYEMVRPNLDNIPDVPMPEGLEVRPAKPEHYRAIWEAENEAFKDHWAKGTTEEADYTRWLDHPMQQPQLWQIAWDGDQVAGIIRNFIDEKQNEKYGRKRGYVENISVRRPWRRRGLARALIARSFKVHKDLGMTQAALGVDSENPSGALQLYKDMGFEVTKIFTGYRKPMN